MNDHPTHRPVYDPWAMAGESRLDEDGKARAGKPLEKGTPVASETGVIAALQTVYDPEIPVNIYDLGLIYQLDIDPDGTTRILMTLTAPGCPVAGILPAQVAEAVAEVPGIGEVEVELTWEPAWDKSRMSEIAQLELGMY
jgi:FeS assembly SUF system protein